MSQLRDYTTVDLPAHGYIKRKMHKLASVNVKIVQQGGSDSVGERERADCAALCQALRGIKEEEGRRAATWMEKGGKPMPYDVPGVGSLDYEAQRLSKMRTRLRLYRDALCQTDAEAISLDWKKIGEDRTDSASTDFAAV